MTDEKTGDKQLLYPVGIGWLSNVNYNTSFNHNVPKRYKKLQRGVKKMCDYFTEGGVSYGHEIAVRVVSVVWQRITLH